MHPKCGQANLFHSVVQLFYTILRCGFTTGDWLPVCGFILHKMNQNWVATLLTGSNSAVLFYYKITHYCVIYRENYSIIFHLLRTKSPNSFKNLYLNCTKSKLIFRRWNCWNFTARAERENMSRASKK